MAQKTIVMNLIKQVQQLRQEGVAIKEIVRRVDLNRKTVKKYLRRIENIPLQTDEAMPITDKEMADIVYNNDTNPVSGKRKKELLEILNMQKRTL